MKQKAFEETARYGYRRKSQIDKTSSSSNNKKMYKIIPVSLGAISSIKDKSQIFLGSNMIYTINDRKIVQKIVHPLYKYVFKKFVLYQLYYKKKPSDFKSLIMGQFSCNYNPSNPFEHETFIKEDILSIIQDFDKNADKYRSNNPPPSTIRKISMLNEYVQKCKQLKKESIQQFKIIYKKYKDYRTKWQQLLKQQLFDKINKEQIIKLYLKDQCEQNTQHFRNLSIYELLNRLTINPVISLYLKGNQNLNYQNQYLDYIIDSLDNIQPLRTDQIDNKITMFTQKYNRFWKTQGGLDNDDRNYNNRTIRTIKITPLTPEIQSILQNLTDLVNMKKKEINYQAQYRQLIKDLILTIQSFSGRGSNKNSKCFYKCLSPKNIYFDQLKLMPILSYIPLLQQALGLKKKPITIMNKIVFFPTPKIPDYFQSLIEQYQKIKLILNDHYYGCIQMYDPFQAKVRTDQRQQLNKQKQRLEEIQQIMTVQRFLLVSSYLVDPQNYKNKFGKFSLQSYNKSSFKQCLQEQFYDPSFFNKHEGFAQEVQNVNKLNIELQSSKKGKLVSNIRHLQNYLNIKNEKIQESQFHFSMEEILEYLDASSLDSTIENNKYFRIKKYFSLRNTIIMEIIRILISQGIFLRVFNVKKFIIMFLIMIKEYMQQIKKINAVELEKSGQRKLLKQYLTQKLKRKSQKNSMTLIQSTYEKIKDYKNRQKNDVQAKYVNDDENGKICWKQVERYKQIVNRLLELENKFDSKQNPDDQAQKSKCLQYINQMGEIIKKEQQNINILLIQLIYIEMRKYKDGPHKIAQNMKKCEILYTYYTKKIELLIFSFISFSQDQQIIYQSIIVPLFQVQQNETKKIQISMPVQQKILGQFQEKVSNLQYIKEMIQYQRLIPTNFIYIQSKVNKHNRSQSIIQSMINDSKPTYLNPYKGNTEHIIVQQIQQ